MGQIPGADRTGLREDCPHPRGEPRSKQVQSNERRDREDLSIWLTRERDREPSQHLTRANETHSEEAMALLVRALPAASTLGEV